jgi:CRP/FNR family transcriptional regulator
MNMAIVLPITSAAVIAPCICSDCDARAVSVCSALPAKFLFHLARIAIRGAASPNVTFIAEGDSAEDYFNVSAGTARVYKLLPNGRRQITGFASAGDFLGLAVSAQFAFSAEAIDDVEFCRYPRNSWHALISEFPVMAQFLLDIASNELVAAQEQMLLLGRKTARERLASFLIELADRATPGQVALPMTRVDIADYLGLTVETVSRNMTQLSVDGVISVSRSRTSIAVIDGARLRALANGSDISSPI